VSQRQGGEKGGGISIVLQMAFIVNEGRLRRGGSALKGEEDFSAKGGFCFLGEAYKKAEGEFRVVWLGKGEWLF